MWIIILPPKYGRNNLGYETSNARYDTSNFGCDTSNLGCDTGSLEYGVILRQKRG